MIGRTLSHYRVLAEISRGGMGIVYRALDVKLNREVALKVLPPELVADSGRRARFVQEARAAAALEHPHIAVVYEVDEIDGTDFIAMELIRGEKLSDVLGRGKLSRNRVLELGIEIAEGLGRAHEKGIIHRDVKPANVMVTDEGHVKVIDFGLAKLTEWEPRAGSEIETALRNQTTPGVAMGTLSHMSPEQAKGEPVDPRTDVFSLGVLLYEMLVGELPFKGSNAPDVLHAIVHQPAPRLPSDLSPLQGLLDRCLAKPPSERFARMDDVVQELRAARESQGRVRHRLAPWVIAAAAVAVVVGFLASRNSGSRWVREEAIPHISRLADEDRYGEAFRIAQQAERELGPDAALESLWPRISRPVSIRTEPAGADVYLRPFPHGVGGEQPLGKSPIDSARVPLGAYWLRVKSPGYQQIEALMGPSEWFPEVAFELQPLEAAPAGMVHVPAGPLFVDLAGFDTVEPRDSDGYWIDENEVTNREFKEFVDAGGYGNPEFWEHAIEKAGRVLTFAESRAEFRDRTGRPGPATWEGGTYPPVQEDFPVSGVSWYEAAAYAKFRDRSLPTIYHWTSATDTIHLAVAILTFSNLDGQGTEAALSRPPGPRGTRHMAGNVKEWCWNEWDGARYLLGGAWNEPSHLFTQPDSRDPLDRSPENGFRTAIFPDPDDPELEAMRRPMARPTLRARDVKPVDDVLFGAYKATFDYDPLPLEAVVEGVDESSPHWIKERITINAAYGGERFSLYLFLPRNVQPPFQAIVYFPGSGVIHANSSADLDQIAFIDFIVMSGRAVLYPVYKGTYERRDPRLKFTDANPTLTYVEFVSQWVKDVRRSVDYLEQREDVDSRRIGYHSVSWGPRLANIILAVDERIRAAVLIAGGFPHVQPRPEVDETNYAPRVRVPVLMLNGTHDSIFTLDGNQRPMFELLGSGEKEHVLFESGHTLIGFRNQMIRHTLDWFDRHLGPVS